MSLADRYPFPDVRRESDIPDVGRLEPEPDQNEFSSEPVALVHVEQLAIFREDGDRLRRPAERSEERVRERGGSRRRRRRSDLRSLLTGRAYTIPVDVALVRVLHVGTVVLKIG